MQYTGDEEDFTKMANMVNVYFYGKKYSVPADLTIMTAMDMPDTR